MITLEECVKETLNDRLTRIVEYMVVNFTHTECAVMFAKLHWLYSQARPAEELEVLRVISPKHKGRGE